MANRFVCSVLEEMRALFKTHNYASFPGLIEEVQTLVNRMEAALQDQKDIEWKAKELKNLRKEIKELKQEKVDLESK